MVLKLSEKIAVYLFKKGRIAEEEIEIFRYGYSIILDGIIDFAVLIIAGILLHRLMEVCIFAVVFSMLRQFTGGYHAEKRISCIIMSLSVCILCAFSPVFIPQGAAKIFIYAGPVVSTLFIIWRAPVENSKKKLDASLIKKNKKKAIIMSFVFMGMAFVAGIGFVEYATVIAASMVMVSVLVLAALISNV